MSDEEYLESKRKTYGQYRPISSNKVHSDYLNNSKFMSPRKAAINKVNSSQVYTSPSQNSNISNSSYLQGNMNTSITLETCQYCERKFSKESIGRHLKTCEKDFKSKSKGITASPRKAESFKSDNPYSNQKISNNKLNMEDVRSMSEAKNKTSKKTNWRENSQNLRRAIGVAKEFTDSELPPLVLRYNQCPNCLKQFTEFGLKLHKQECDLRKMRLENRQISRQLGSGMLGYSRRSQL